MNLFLFHRDLRLIDNTALIKQLVSFKKITPIFIFPPIQIDPKLNKYFSHNSVQFMIESLRELSEEIKQFEGNLYFFKGHNLEVLKELQKFKKINSIAYNLDYTPFAKSRDHEILEWASKNKIEIIAEEDYGLYPMLNGDLLNQKSQKPYLVFTPFKNYCLKNLKVRLPNPYKSFNFEKINQLTSLCSSLGINELDSLFENNNSIALNGGRNNGLSIINQIKQFNCYNQTRNHPSLPTTKLSAHLHFTTVSIREVYHKVYHELGLENNLINEIHWREFYMCITNYFPKVLEGKSFKEKFDEIEWKYNEAFMEAWKEGKTGFPIVDAAMRELKTSGWMHNRARMIVSSFLAKDLFLDWHEGERYFASKLVDYSPTQNSGGWQWTVGNGTDAAPYFRIFNPWTQQKTYDEDCTYIKKWIPELKNIPINDIHNWSVTHQIYHKKGIDYPAPIINHDEARKETLKFYKKYLKKENE